MSPAALRTFQSALADQSPFRGTVELITLVEGDDVSTEVTAVDIVRSSTRQVLAPGGREKTGRCTVRILKSELAAEPNKAAAVLRLDGASGPRYKIVDVQGQDEHCHAWRLEGEEL